MIAKFKAWAIAFRFKTLSAALVPIVVATAMTQALYGDYKSWISLYALLAAFCIQIATNLFNDAIDFKKGADTQDRIGPLRVTQGGLLSERQVWAMGLFFLLVATALGWPLVVRGGIPIVVLGLVSLFMAYSYTGGPFPLAYLGLGDLFVILFFGLFAVGGTFYLQNLSMTPGVWVAGLQVGFLSTILIAINNLRDSESDAVVNKRTLAVRFGDAFVKLEIVALTLLTYILSFYYLLYWNKLYVLLTFAISPLAVLIVGWVFAVQNKKQLNVALGLAALHQLIFTGLLSLGLVL